MYRLDEDVYFNAKAWATRTFTVAWALNTWASYADKKAKTVVVAHLDTDSSSFGEAEEPSSSDSDTESAQDEKGEDSPSD